MNIKKEGEITAWYYIYSYTKLGPNTRECPTKEEILSYPHSGISWDDPEFNPLDDSYKDYKKLNVDNYTHQNVGNTETVPNGNTNNFFNPHRVLLDRYQRTTRISSNIPTTVPVNGSTFTFKVLVGFITKKNPINDLKSDTTYSSIKGFKFEHQYLYNGYVNQNNGVSNEEFSSYYSHYGVTYEIGELDEDGYQEITVNIPENTSTSERTFRFAFGVTPRGLSNNNLYNIIYDTDFYTITQAAAVETWDYRFVIAYSKVNFLAVGGKGTPDTLTIISERDQYINGKFTGVSEPVEYTQSAGVDWLTLTDNKPVANENKSESSRTHAITYTQKTSGKKGTITFIQAAGVKTYGPLVATQASNIPDIPASGGTAGFFTYSYEQTWGWNGDTTNGGIITSGATESWTEAISGSNLGTTPKARTKLGVRTVTLTLHGGSELGTTITRDVYQAANDVVKTTQGAWEVSISANPSTLTEMGGTSQISASARASRTNTWSSGATSAASDATGTPTLSIPTPVTGFSLSGNTLTVAENTTANDRSVVVRATMDTVYEEVTVTQSEYSVEWVYTLTTSTPTLNFDALGTIQSGTISSYREKYINGSLVEGSHEGVNIQVKSTSAEIQSATADVAITMEENTTTQARTGTVVYEQVGSGKTVTITCNQAAGTITTRDVLNWISGIPNSAPAIGGSVIGEIRSGYWDVVNGKDTTFHPVVPTIDLKPDYVTVEFTPSGSTLNNYKVSITFTENNTESSRVARIQLSYGSKTLGFNVNQEAASVAWSYELKVNNSTQDLNQQVPAKPSGTYSFTISSKRYKIVNGSVTSQSEDTTWTTSISDSPSWVHVEEQSGTLILRLDENTITSQRSADIIIFQTVGDGSITLTVEQQAASITTNRVINYVDPIPSGNIPAKQSLVEITVESYIETIINGNVSNKVKVTPTVDLYFDGSETGWATTNIVEPDNSEYQYIIQVEVGENRGSTRSGSIMPKNGTIEAENSWSFTQDAATISTSYNVFLRRRYNGEVTDNVTEGTITGETGLTATNIVIFEIIIEKVTTINGSQSTELISSMGIGLATNNSMTSTPSGQLTANIQDVSGFNNAAITIRNIHENLSESPRTHKVNAYRKDITIDGVVIGQIPEITILVDPIPYTRVFEFSWKQEGSTITNITLNGDIYGSSAGSRDIISYASLRRDGVEFAKKYIKPTFIPPSEDWLQVIDNGQNSDNSYNWAFKALTNNEGESARNQSVRFEQSGNGNQSLYAYVSQDPMLVDLVMNIDCYNTPVMASTPDVKASYQGNLNSGPINDTSTLIRGEYIACLNDVNLGTAFIQFTTYPTQSTEARVSLKNIYLQLESGENTPLSIGPSGSGADLEYGTIESYPGFTISVHDYGQDGAGNGYIDFRILKTDSEVWEEMYQMGFISIAHTNPDWDHGDINVDFFYGTP